MAIDPRFASLVQALSGMAKQNSVGAPAGMPSPVQSDYGAAQSQAALQNPQTQAALEGANAPSPAAQRAANAEGLLNAAQTGQQQTTAGNQPMTPGSGGVIQTQQQGTTLGNQTPANLTPEQAAQAQQQAQTASEQGLWNTIISNLTGHDANGQMLQGEALRDFQLGHTMGGFLGALGAGIGGESTGGRLGNAVYQQAAGGLAANNAERQQANQNDFMQQALTALTQRAGGAIPGVVNTPNRPQYTPFTAGGTTGAPSQASPSVLQDQGGTPTMTSLDESIARMKRLSGLA